jgi:hypothetical protein
MNITSRKPRVRSFAHFRPTILRSRLDPTDLISKTVTADYRGKYGPGPAFLLCCIIVLELVVVLVLDFATQDL